MAFLIDPAARSVEKVVCLMTLDDILRLVQVERVSVVELPGDGGSDDIWVDDEGLFGASHFFALPGLHQPLAGRGLVLGATRNGDSRDPQHCSLEDLRRTVGFGQANPAKGSISGDATFTEICNRLRAEGCL